MEIDNSSQKFLLTPLEQNALGLEKTNANESGMYEWDVSLAPELLEAAERAREGQLEMDMANQFDGPARMQERLDRQRNADALRGVIRQLEPFLQLDIRGPEQFLD